MSYKQIVFVTIFVILIYVLLNKSRMSNIDSVLILVSVIALFWNQIKVYQSSNIFESFAADGDSDITNILNTIKQVDDEENISTIMNNLSIYCTAFNKLSYTIGSKEWRNLMDVSTDKNGSLVCPTQLNFDVVPAYSRQNGFSLSSNFLKGPFSNTLKISYKTPYTIMLAFKNGLLTNDRTTNQRVELLKLFANSDNNNGLSLYFESGSLKSQNNTEFGKLMFQYSNNTPVELKLASTDNLFKVDNNILSLIYIVRYEDKLRILYMTEKNNNVYELAKFNITNDDITFSNKELYINRYKNWNANIYTFAIYRSALTDANISNIYEHIKSLYIKFNDPNYISMADKYNSMIDLIRQLVKCPFDKPVCDACKSITQWNDFTQIINAPLDCRKAISQYCQTNTKNSFCQCWDTSSSIYNTPGCRMLRDVFASDGKLVCSNLTEDDIKCIKSKYNLTDQPKTKPKGKKKDTELEYDSTYSFDKIRINYGDSQYTCTAKNDSLFSSTNNKVESVSELKKRFEMNVNDYYNPTLNWSTQSSSSEANLVNPTSAQATNTSLWSKFVSLFTG